MNDSSSVSVANASIASSIVPQGFSQEFKIGIIFAYAVVFTIALLGNSMGLFLVLRKSSSASITNLFIANMTVADLLLTVTIMPLQVANLFGGDAWIPGILGNVTCKVVFYIIPVSIAATVFTMMFISFDRFYAIFYPFREKIFRKPKILSATIWILSLVLMIPYPIMYRVQYRPELDTHLCLQLWPWQDENDPTYAETYRVLKIFHITIFIVLYALPLSITTFVYFLICRKLWLRKIPGNVTNTNHAAAKKSKRKVVRLLVLILLVFVICWFPSYVNHYIWYVRPDLSNLLPGETLFWFIWLGHANSAINPCLYILLNNKFRKELFMTMTCCSSFRVRLARFLSALSQNEEENSFTTGGTMWKMMSFGRITAYTLPHSPSEKQERGHTIMALSQMSIKEGNSYPKSPPPHNQNQNSSQNTCHSGDDVLQVYHSS
ncbi:prolactin-releasing peptide receptor-like [Stylophora pistillata]|uniref:Orexin receptor type 2 n=1 Tax=Stylophora pistillata TaxID=50429 RepID=A0A2B4SAJ4_STYPI|nr:prolactin-releasing peptide receptor-like [Stylophora pistillata]XP_022789341.1 prolactin-releasing peptide receptor-like [Stylophora pistillata]XP_022789342.1 prolactin-releasing peptide receptor-like [Stylophora pistillata]XP_022789343.1 prolactin-releasing peptide receptor-like [Stylophora pistillata]XP_022789344.1 prolactin-releasing peptide receptor-like [Stylophora pistillata]XP_022789345.1 prolactin-releasing peptide receptor-like [Stylophora pistillata]XP_022789346.1 prolactin-rele